VAALQQRHGLDVDRNFGPQTRKAFYSETGIDIDSIVRRSLTGPTIVPEVEKV
jgi:peptidoglycan hydrolase-like protein with peptidoglycan-binding domain